MKFSWQSILGTMSVAAVITIGTIVYKAGHKDGANEITNQMVFEAVQRNQSTLTLLTCNYNDISQKLDSISGDIEKNEHDRAEQFRLIQKEVDILIRQDKSGEALKSINEWRNWYETRYLLQQIEKKNLKDGLYVLKQ